MKKILSIIIMLSMITILFVGCGKIGQSPAEEKDVSELLSILEQDIDAVDALGELPEPEIKGNLYYYNNAETEGYFHGFHLGLEIDEASIVQRIYIQPYGDNKIQVQGLMIGDTVAAAEALFGVGQKVPDDNTGSEYTYTVYSTEKFDIKCTLEGEIIRAVSITKPGMQKVYQEPEFQISAVLTQKEVTELLGADFQIETKEDGGYYDYYTTMTYDGITFGYAHNRYPFSDVNVADYVQITSDRYSLSALSAQVGDLAKPVLKYCDQNFDLMYDRHNEKEVYGNYLYFEEGKSTPGGRTTWLLSFEFDQDVELTSYDQLPDDLRITEIHLWTELD
ncbi:hypothetical protein JR334_05785 [Clostridia bacterium]|nr:hypothetical protein JR334_05785 [Clostridia bacterium]